MTIFIYFDSMLWNWSLSSIYDDEIFVANFVNQAIVDEIRWPTPQERRILGRHIPRVPGCIGFMDGTLVRIRRPYENANHSKWFQGKKNVLHEFISIDWLQWSILFC